MKVNYKAILLVPAYFIMASGFMFIGNLMGYYRGYNKGYPDGYRVAKKLFVPLSSTQVLDEYFVDSCYNFLDGAKLDLPEEIMTVTNYDEPQLDLFIGFVDDGGDIHFQFLGDKINRSEIPGRLFNDSTLEREVKPVLSISDKLTTKR